MEYFLSISNLNIKLYHAISLNDFHTYIKEGGILSREKLSESNPYFTRFFSDPKDIQLGCWNRTFGNFTDLGARFGNFGNSVPNAFGPINIVLSKSVLNDLSDVKVTKVSISQQKYNANEHDVEMSKLSALFNENNGTHYPNNESQGLEFSSSTECIEWKHVAYILVDPIEFNGKSLKAEVERILSQNGIHKKVLHRNIKCEETLEHLLQFSGALAGSLLHKNQKLEDVVPENLSCWLSELNPIGKSILASWLTYTYNGTLLHLK
jgi:hypothetical protein